MGRIPGFDASKKLQSGGGSAQSLALDMLVPQKRDSLENRVVRAFEEWRDPVYRYLVIAGGNPTEAEEIVQECFIRLFQTLHAGKPVEHTQRWLFRVAHNLFIDHTRRIQPHSASSPELSHVVEGRHDPQPNPEQLLLREERLGQVRRALESLTALQRNCIHLRAEGFRHREIAEILDISMDSVADALRRGLTRLSRNSYE